MREKVVKVTGICEVLSAIVANVAANPVRECITYVGIYIYIYITRREDVYMPILLISIQTSIYIYIHV